jgi:uncharacterized surface protein with fasciclin (FAS1) repeats
MKKVNRIAIGALGIAIALAGIPAFAGSCKASQQAAMNADASSDIVGTAVAAGSFNTLIAAVQAAGLEDALRGDGPLTVFAPTDEAFAKLPEGTLEALLKPENKELLTSILTYHVAPGRLTAERVVEMDRVETLNGQQPAIETNAGSVKIAGANITATDIAASNGVIHVIDSVMMPSDDDAVRWSAASIDEIHAAHGVVCPAVHTCPGSKKAELASTVASN